MASLKMRTVFTFMKNFQCISFGILEMEVNIILAWTNAFLLLKIYTTERMIVRVCYFIVDSQSSNQVHICT